MQQKNLADFRLKVSIIYKHILSKQDELKYQVKKHATSEKLSKRNK